MAAADASRGDNAIPAQSLPQKVPSRKQDAQQPQSPLAAEKQVKAVYVDLE